MFVHTLLLGFGNLMFVCYFMFDTGIGPLSEMDKVAGDVIVVSYYCTLLCSLGI
jgi:hypothetical protein